MVRNSTTDKKNEEIENKNTVKAKVKCHLQNNIVVYMP